MSASQATFVYDTSTYTRIADPRTLIATRIGWVLLVCLCLLVKLALQPYIYAETSVDAALHSAELARLGLSQSFFLNYFQFTSLLIMAAYVITGLIIFWRRSDTTVPLFIALGLALYGTQVSGNYIPIVQDPLMQTLLASMRFITNVVINTAIFVFPDGRFSIRWMRWLLIGYIVVDAIRIAVLLLEPRVGNAEPTFLILRRALFYLSLAPALGAVWSQVYRYRHAITVTQRQQSKWVVFGVAAAVLAEIIYAVIVYINLSVVALFVVDFVASALQLLLPIAVTFAILRYRLYDIDLIINRSLVYGLVTLLLAAVFLGGAYLLQSLLGREQSGITLIASLLAAGAVFNPVRKQTQHFIDRRFYHLRFDLNELAESQEKPNVENSGVLTGRILNGYQLLGVIGRGGMGEVYKGVGNGRTVAIKILPGDLAQQVAFRTRFEREAEVLANFNQPNIVKIYDAGECDGLLYMAMEYVDGQELGAIIRQNGRLSLAAIRPFAADFAAALDHAHANGLVHRDIKPSNIMVRQKPDSNTQEAVLMDFGVAKIQDARTSITGTGAIGTIDYMAPEQIADAREVDHRADIYALGVVLYEMLTGERPFKGGPAQVLFAHLYQPPPDPRQIVPELPEMIASAVIRALAKKPEDRWQTVRALAEAIM